MTIPWCNDIIVNIIKIVFTISGMMKANLKNLCVLSLMTALMVICAWITIPFAVPFTLQTFALFLSLLLFGGRKTLVCVGLYLILGIIGLPVFSAFGSGFGVLFGASGGFLIGFLIASAVFLVFCTIFGNGDTVKVIGCVLSMIIYCFCGTAWYFILYVGDGINVSTAFYACALPFVLPDMVKLFIAYTVYLKLKRVVGINRTLN